MADTPTSPLPSETSTFNLAYVLDAEAAEIARRFPEAQTAADIPDRIGLCFSGGGIRSACVGLGVTQSLARHRLFERVHYISAISGGGYLLGCLSAWMKRVGFADVNRQLAGDFEPPVASPSLKAYPRFLEPEVIRHLRRYSSYLTPRLGLLGGDSLAMASIYLRNLLLNLAMLISGLFALTLVLQLLAPQRLFHDPLSGWTVVVFFVLILLCFGISVGFCKRQIGAIRNGVEGSGMLSMVAVFIGLAGCALLWFVTPSFYRYHHTRTMMFGIVFICGLLGLAITGYSVRKDEKLRAGLPDTQRLKAVKNLNPAILALAWSFAALLVAGIALLFFGHLEQGGQIVVSGGYVIAGLPAILACFPLVSFLFIGILGDRFPDGEREWLARFAGYFLSAAIVFLFVMTIALEGPASMQWIFDNLQIWGWKGVGAAILPGGWAYITLTGVLKGGSSDTSGKEPVHTYTGVIIAVAPPVFLAGVLLLVSWGAHTLAVKSGAIEDPASLSIPTPQKKAPASCCCARPLAAQDKIFRLKELRRPDPYDRREISNVREIQDYCEFELGRLRGLVPHHPGKTPWQRPNGTWVSLVARDGPDHGNNFIYLVLIFAFSGFAVILAWRLDANEFSMHLFYRNRLVRAFAGASNVGRQPNAFTGFAKTDDLRLSTLVPKQKPEVNDPIPRAYDGPYPIWGTTLNITKGEDLSLQQRKGTSFIYSPLFCGWDYVVPDPSKNSQPDPSPLQWDKPQHSANGAEPAYGYRQTSGYGGGVYIGTAMAASGAAASPNMGFHTRPGVAALMALFNVRLGWWTGNPRNSKTWCEYAPGAYYLLDELFTAAKDSDNYVYLSDGGHFENLGIYELVRRRVRFIIAVDADADHEYGFDNLGNAVEHCRRDFGVEISIQAAKDMAPKKDCPGQRAQCYSIGAIRYPATKKGDKPATGVLLYIKSALTGNEPADVLAMVNNYKNFPHDSTANQFFNESLFESYRALGEHMMDAVLRDSRPEIANFLPTIDFAKGDPSKNIQLFYQKLDKKAPTQ